MPLNKNQQKQFNMVCERIAAGASLVDVTKAKDVPSRDTINRWLAGDEDGELQGTYARARSSLFLFIICCFYANVQAVEGYKRLMFGMSIQQAFALNLCDLKEAKIPPINNVERYNDFACENLPYEGRLIPLTIQFIDNTLQRIVIIVSNEVNTRKPILEKILSRHRTFFAWPHNLFHILKHPSPDPSS